MCRIREECTTNYRSSTEQDIVDFKESDRYEREWEHIGALPERERHRKTRRNERMREEYLQKPNRSASNLQR